MTTTSTAAPLLRSLCELSAQAATGALSNDRGTLYLVAGRIGHAESPLAPGLKALLTGSGAVDPVGWQEAVEESGVQRRVGRRLVDSGRLSAGALELCHLGVLFDAAYFALSSDSRPPRFRPGAAHWLGAVRPVAVDLVIRESRRRHDRLQCIWPEPDIDRVPLTRVPDAPCVTLPARRSRALAEVDGVRTAAQIAAALAWRTYPTLVELRRLAAAGLVTTAPPPARRPGAHVSGPAVAACDEPDIALLLRLRDALEAL
ncbi:hypothetical protein ACL02U_03210 [Streptomyces sp. MS06]|uniref:hypothetical protein n=1 Tax=Streptomyces sp. MS06 TaxID=3385974 RepID=UPI0039A1F187